MCGFAGILARHANLVDATTLRQMGDAIRLRGPDDHGVWIGAENTIGLSHRRLSIVDISEAGHQPMHSLSGRYVIAYNGEVYNHMELRQTLESRGVTQWRGHSDTETLLAGFEIWGVEETLRRAVGMFALALWDQRERTLTLARDRLGEKPLYYGWAGEGGRRAFLFGSDLAALRVHPSFDAAEDPSALREFLRLGYVPAPRSFFTCIKKLEAGQLFTLSLDRPEPIPAYYWDPASLFRRPPSFTGTAHDAVEELERLLATAVKRQMMADVPLGAFLSGGIDSSTVVALAQAQSTRPVKTFSIGFGDTDHNEAKYAAKIAAHLKTDHCELYVTEEMAQAVVPKLPLIYSEPFADSSQIPMYLVSELARKSVTVALSGDGGDELFAGYNRYVMANKYFHTVGALPVPLRRFFANCLGSISPTTWSKIQGILGTPMGLSKLSEKVPKIEMALRAHSADALYTSLTSINSLADTLIRPEYLDRAGRSGCRPPTGAYEGDVAEMMATDLVTYLPDDILCKVDRAAMAVSLETRVPLLDHEVVEFAWSLPQSIKLHNNIGKWPLRQVLYKHVPRELIERPKMGFSVPLDRWLRGPLSQWTESLIYSGTQDGLNSVAVQSLWERHKTGRENLGNSLWPIVMYRAWRANRSL